MAKQGVVEDFIEALEDGEFISKKQMKEILDALWELDPRYFEAAGYYKEEEDDDDFYPEKEEAY